MQPDAAAAEQIARRTAEVARAHGLTARPTAPARLHLSLNFIGGFRGPPPRGAIDKAGEVAETIEAAPFTVSLNRIESWTGEPHPLVLSGDDGVIGVQLLHTALHKALVLKTMASRREPEIWPHVTLMWDRAAAPRTLIEPVAWTVSEFVLLDSVHGEGRHEVLGRWPLVG